MDKTFLDLQETKTSDAIFGQVMHKGTFFSIRYKCCNNIPFFIEIPVTPSNNWINEGDIIEMNLEIYIGDKE